MCSRFEIELRCLRVNKLYSEITFRNLSCFPSWINKSSDLVLCWYHLLCLDGVFSIDVFSWTKKTFFFALQWARTSQTNLLQHCCTEDLILNCPFLNTLRREWGCVDRGGVTTFVFAAGITLQWNQQTRMEWWQMTPRITILLLKSEELHQYIYA